MFQVNNNWGKRWLVIKISKIYNFFIMCCDLEQINTVLFFSMYCNFIPRVVAGVFRKKIFKEAWKRHRESLLEKDHAESPMQSSGSGPEPKSGAGSGWLRNLGSELDSELWKKISWDHIRCWLPVPFLDSEEKNYFWKVQLRLIKIFFCQKNAGSCSEALLATNEFKPASRPAEKAPIWLNFLGRLVGQICTD